MTELQNLNLDIQASNKVIHSASYLTILVYINSAITGVIILALCSIHCSRDTIGRFCSYIRICINKPVDYNEAPTVELVEMDPDERVKSLKGISSDNAVHTEPLAHDIVIID